MHSSSRYCPAQWGAGHASARSGGRIRDAQHRPARGAQGGWNSASDAELIVFIVPPARWLQCRSASKMQLDAAPLPAPLGKLMAGNSRENESAVSHMNSSIRAFAKSAGGHAMTTLLSHLVAAANQHPDRPAVIDGARRLTYRELHERSTALAAELARAGAGPGQRVGIHLPSGLDAVVAVWATLKTGAAYVPVDVAKPGERRARMLHEIDPKVVVTTGSFDLDSGRETVDVAAAYAGPLKAPPEVTVRPDDPAYIFYTSGSTGAPKAVVLTHRNATTFVDWAVRAFKITSSDRIAGHAPVHCDLSTFDLFGSVKAAATLVAVPTPARVSGNELAIFLHDSSCTVLYCVPSALTMLVEAAASASALGSLRVVPFGGEICPQATLRAMLRLTTNTRFANLYGLTATNVCIFHEVDPVLDLVGHSLPIGRAVTPEVQARVMAAPNREAETGEPGELVVSGPVVAQGYWDDPALTRARFAPDDAGAVDRRCRDPEADISRPAAPGMRQGHSR